MVSFDASCPERVMSNSPHTPPQHTGIVCLKDPPSTRLRNAASSPPFQSGLLI